MDRNNFLNSMKFTEFLFQFQAAKIVRENHNGKYIPVFLTDFMTLYKNSNEDKIRET